MYMSGTYVEQEANTTGSSEERTRQAVALEKIAVALETLCMEIRAVREALIRIGNRTGRSDE